MILPPSIEVTLQAADARHAEVSDILVALDIFWHGRYYYGVHLGLTDDSGRVRVTSRDIVAQFTEDQRLCPMDLKVPLQDCDDSATLRIMGSADFLKHRSELVPGWVTPDAIARWARARNGVYRSVRETIELSTAKPLRVTITIEQA